MVSLSYRESHFDWPLLAYCFSLFDVQPSQVRFSVAARLRLRAAVLIVTHIFPRMFFVFPHRSLPDLLDPARQHRGLAHLRGHVPRVPLVGEVRARVQTRELLQLARGRVVAEARVQP